MQHTKYVLTNCMLLVRLLVNTRLFVVKCLGSQKLYLGFQLCEGLAPLTP